MNDHELTQLLARIHTHDNRQVDELVLGHWKAAVGDLPYNDAFAGVETHIRESTAYLLPAHVRANAKRIREQRALAEGYDGIEDGKSYAPRPDNEDAMSAAWNNPAEFAHQCAIYNRQLLNAGYPTDDCYPIAPESEAA